MSVSLIPTYNTTGVRPLTLKGWGLGSAADVAAQMKADGYDSGIINTLVAQGATEAQLQNLYDNYGANTPEFSDAAQSLILGLTPVPNPSIPMTTSAAGSAYGIASAIVTSPFGAFDLSLKSSWDAIASQISVIQQTLNQAAALNPKDPTVISYVGQFNQNVAQFASYYQQAFGSPLSPVPLASIPTLGDVASTQQWWGPVLGPIGYILSFLYNVWQWAKNYIAQDQAIKAANAQAAQTSASSVASLTAAYNQAVASGNTARAQQLLAAIQAAGGANAPKPADWTTFLQKNFGLIVLVLAGIAIVPPLVKKL